MVKVFQTWLKLNHFFGRLLIKPTLISCLESVTPSFTGSFMKIYTWQRFEKLFHLQCFLKVLQAIFKSMTLFSLTSERHSLFRTGSFHVCMAVGNLINGSIRS